MPTLKGHSLLPVFFAGAAGLFAAEPKTDAERLTGAWLFDEYRTSRGSNLGQVWFSVVTVADGEVTLAKVLDEKVKGYKKEVWKDRDLPFPVALVSGQGTESGARGKLADLYGIRGYPSTVLIDRDGKVVGKFHARDVKSAAAEMERILKADKK
jgi:hypothetical protein